MPSSPEQMISECETMSPIIIGSKGKINNESFEVKGCITLFQTSKVVNLHTILWYNGLYNYILECEGDYSLLNFTDENPNPALKTIKVDKVIELKDFGKAYCYSLDRITLISLKGDGKLPFHKLCRSVLGSFYSVNSKTAYCFYSKEKTFLLTGTFYKLEELNLTQTRTLNEWYK